MQLLTVERTKPENVAIVQSMLDEDLNWQDAGTDELLKANTTIAKHQETEASKEKTKRLERLTVRYNYSRAKRDAVRLRFMCGNNKTGDSVDFTNDCIFKCSYCYVNSPHMEKQRAQGKTWEIEPDYLTPEREQVFREYLRARKAIVSNYPLRFFSLADCPDSHVSMLKRLLQICLEENTSTIVISKNEAIIPHVYGLATSLLYSVDTGGYNAPTSITRYVQLLETYPKLRAFFMVVDLPDFATVDGWVNTYGLQHFQIVAYHGQLKDTEIRKTPVVSAHGKMLKPGLLSVLSNQAWGKNVSCCMPNKCVSCPIKCGVTAKDVKAKLRLKSPEVSK